MFFPFSNFETYDFSVNADVDEVVFQTDSTCLICVQWTKFDIDAGESVRVYVQDGGDVVDDITVTHIAKDAFSAYTANFSGAIVVDSGRNVRIETINENNVEGKIHVWWMPTSA